MNKAGSVFLVLFLILCPGSVTRAEVFQWPETTPAAVDIDPQMISQITAAVERGDYGRLKSVLIVRHGRL